MDYGCLKLGHILKYLGTLNNWFILKLICQLILKKNCIVYTYFLAKNVHIILFFYIVFWGKTGTPIKKKLKIPLIMYSSLGISNLILIQDTSNYYCAEFHSPTLPTSSFLPQNSLLGTLCTTSHHNVSAQEGPRHAMGCWTVV